MTNADKIKQMTNEELARFLIYYDYEIGEYAYLRQIGDKLRVYDSVESFDEAIKRQIAMLESEV